MRDLAGRAPRSSSPLFSVVAPVTDRVLLGFDYGARRIGVAIANSVTREARPLVTVDDATIAARWNTIAALVREWEPARFVVGIPRHPDGTPHAMTGRCERFARQLEGRFGRPVERVDERYSSAISAGAVDVDAAAATVILQQWLDEEEVRDA
jgi:putative Holliday junction resolvase